MKKITVLSIVAASLLLAGCNESSTGAEAKAAATPVAEKAADATAAHAEKATEAAAGHAEKATEAVADHADKATEAAASHTEKAVEATKDAAHEVKEAVVEKATAATAAVAATATAAVEKTKEAASAVAEKATDAVEGAKEAVSGGDDAGKALFAKCAGCHGADGKTAALGKSAVIAGQAAADLETKIAGYKAGTLDTAGMGALMKGQVAAMSEDDIKAVAAYISGL